VKLSTSTPFPDAPGINSTKEPHVANLTSTLILPRTRPPSGRVGGLKDVEVDVDGDQRVAESLPSAAGAEPLPRSTFDGAQSNGDEGDVRVVKPGGTNGGLMRSSSHQGMQAPPPR
jgi:hypothetical protein